MTLSSGSPSLHPIVVTRTGQGSVEIRWNENTCDGSLTIWRGDSPDTIVTDQPLARVERRCSVVLTGLETDRPHFFHLVPDSGADVIVGERRLPVEGAPNLRDLGGYETEDGRRVKWGRIFRSSNLGRLTDRGLELVKRLGIRLVCDFRTEAEAAKLPNRFPDSTETDYLRLPIQHGDFEPTAVFERIGNGDYGWISEEFMLQGYIESIERFPPVWSAVFGKLAQARQRPLLFHCTGGKDRTGVCAALILLSLGVSRETVIGDYGLSDVCNTEVRHKIYDHLRPTGVDIAKVEPYFTAPPTRLRALLKYVDERFGSAGSYLTNKAGVPEWVIQRLRVDLLE